jgi:tetratricopeptide (TPR) repeat protein
MAARLGALLALLALAVACSSAPPAPTSVQDRKNRAADYLKFGQQAFQETRYAQALSFYLIALDFDTAVDNEAGMAVAWNSVAVAQTALGKLDEARAALAEAEAMAKVTGDRTLILQVAVNLVQADLSAGNNEAARLRLVSLKPFPETAEGAALEHSFGMLQKSLEHPDEALAAFNRALALNQRLGLKQEMASNHFMKASVLGHVGNWTAARSELQLALGLDRTVENTLGIGQDWKALGTVALRLEDPQGAFDAYVRAARLFQAAGLTEQQRKVIEVLLPVTATLGLVDETARYQSILDKLKPPSTP